MLLPRSYMHMHRYKRIEFQRHHTHHSRPTAAALFELHRVYVASSPGHSQFFNWEWPGDEARVYMCDGDILAPLEHQYYQTIETGMTENSLPCLSH